MERKNAWNGYETEELKKVDALNQEYRTFLNEGKTERECVKLAVKMAEEAGYRDLKRGYCQKRDVEGRRQSVRCRHEKNDLFSRSERNRWKKEWQSLVRTLTPHVWILNRIRCTKRAVLLILTPIIMVESKNING